VVNYLSKWCIVDLWCSIRHSGVYNLRGLEKHVPGGRIPANGLGFSVFGFAGSGPSIMRGSLCATQDQMAAILLQLGIDPSLRTGQKASLFPASRRSLRSLIGTVTLYRSLPPDLHRRLCVHRSARFFHFVRSASKLYTQ